MDGLYINDFHRSNSMAAQREAQRMSLHPCSREQKLRQIETLHLMAQLSKEKSNAERIEHIGHCVSRYQVQAAAGWLW